MKKKIEKILMYGFISAIAIGLIYSLSTFIDFDKNNYSEISNIETDKNSFKLISTGSTSSGEVLVELTPHNAKDGKLKIDIEVNTHSVDLTEFDLMQITTLEFDGQTIKPISVPSLNGHHSSGTITFETGKELNSFKVIIKGIPKIGQRLFEWN